MDSYLGAGDRSDSLPADDLLGVQPRVVVIGGPGSGKSTLLRRLMHRVCDGGALAWRVSLRAVAARANAGETFDQAMLRTALDGCGVDDAAGRAALGAPDWVFADGLDECGDRRAAMAAALEAWAEGHPRCRIWVTTRPVGYSPTDLPGFEHVELVPLGEREVEAVGQRLAEAAGLGGSELETLRRRLSRQTSRHEGQGTAATIAARSPLLLSFLVRLAIDGVELSRRRAGLLRQVVAALERTVREDRAPGPAVDRGVARRALNAVAFTLVDRPDASSEELARAATDSLQVGLGEPRLQCEGLATAAIGFWEQRGLLERLRWGSLETLTFVHQSLAEWCAAEHIAGMEDAAFGAWIAESRREPRWREAIALAGAAGAAGKLVRGLLDLDDPTDPTSTETLLAADALAECEGPEGSLVRDVSERLVARLESGIPLVAVEGAERLANLAAYAPGLVGPIGRCLVGQAERWRNFCGIVLSLASGVEYVETSSIVRWLAGFEGVGVPTLRPQAGRGSGLPAEAKELQRRTLVTGVHWLMAHADPRVVRAAVGALLDRGRLWGDTHGRLLADLEAGGFGDVASGNRRWMLRHLNGFGWASVARWDREEQRGMARLLGCLLRAVGGSREKGHQIGGPHPDCTRAVLSAIHFWDVALRGLARRWEPEDEAAAVEVLRGAVVALGLPPALVACEANALLDEAEDGARADWRFYPRLRGVPVQVSWPEALGAGLDPALLDRALQHPSIAVAWTAGDMVEAGVGGARAPLLVQRALWEGEGETLEIVSHLARQMWGERASSVLLERLRFGAPRAGLEGLCAWAADLADQSEVEDVRRALLEAMEREEPRVAEKAAEALARLPAPEGAAEGVEARLREALAEWARRASWCYRCGKSVSGRSCPDCNVVLPSPRAAIVSELDRMGALGAGELRMLRDDQGWDVPEVAAKALARRILHGHEEADYTLEDIVVRGGDVGVLRALLECEDASLLRVAPRLLALTECEDARVRWQVVEALDRGWLQPDEARARARKALSDSDSSVRSAAVRVLRHLDASA